MDYDKLYGLDEKPPPGKPALVIPDTDDLKEMVRAVHPAMTRKVIAMAYESDNLPQVLSAWDKITDRLFGKAEQAVAMTVKDDRPERALGEIYRGAMFALRASEEKVIDLVPVADDK